MQVTFDPTNREDMILIRQLFTSATQAPPTEEAVVDKRPRGRPAKEKDVVVEAKVVETPAPVTSTPEAAPVVVAPAAPVAAPHVPDLFSIETVRAKLIEFSTAVGNQDVAKDILEKLTGTRKLSQIPATKYGEVLVAINDVISKLPKKA